MEDIRQKPYIDVKDLLALNFIRHPENFEYRRHYRYGLRSHIMEVLLSRDVHTESHGIQRGGVRCFPKAEPIKMLRIFRTRFKTLQQAFSEINKVKLMARYLTTDHFASSVEFLVDYVRSDKRDVLLCGLQEYVAGEIFDPWADIGGADLADGLAARISETTSGPPRPAPEELAERIRVKARSFIARTKRMISESGHVPDLAGAGNLILTPDGNLKLVDINNISAVDFGAAVGVDDKGYPVCDKSIEAIARMECKLLNRSLDMQERIYRIFLDPGRMAEVREQERAFRRLVNLPNPE